MLYRGPDDEHHGREICLGANETAIAIVDVTDKDRPFSIAVATYPRVGYAHQGWMDEAHEYYYLNDETKPRVCGIRAPSRAGSSR